MLDTTNPETEVETATQDNSAEEVSNDQTEGQDADDQTDSGQVDDTEEVDIEGERYALPKKLKDKFMLHADYTRKTQEVAESKRAIEAEKAQIQCERETTQANLKAHAELYAIDAQLEQYAKLDWDKLFQDDPIQAAKLDREERALKEARNQRVNDISKNEQEQTLKMQQETAKRLQESAALLQREIQGWNAEKSLELANYIKSYADKGLSKEFFEKVDSGYYGAAPILIAHKAHLYDQLIQKQSQQKQQAEVKPVAQVKSGKSQATTDPAKMTDAQFAAWRRKQIAQRS